MLDERATAGSAGVAATTAPEEPGLVIGPADSSPGEEGAAREGHGAAAGAGKAEDPGNGRKRSPSIITYFFIQ